MHGVFLLKYKYLKNAGANLAKICTLSSFGMLYQRGNVTCAPPFLNVLSEVFKVGLVEQLVPVQIGGEHFDLVVDSQLCNSTLDSGDTAPFSVCE